MASEIIFVDRYSATGKDYPDPATVCKGHCEGMGCVPIHRPTKHSQVETIHELIEEAEFQKRWHSEHERNCNLVGVIRGLFRHRELWYWRSIGRDIWRWIRGKGYCDGWHFVECPECNGTGKQPKTDR